MRTVFTQAVALALLLPGLASAQGVPTPRHPNTLNVEPLNELLTRLREPAKKDLPDPEPVLQARLLGQIHVTRGALGPFVVLLRRPDRLSWPTLLAEEPAARDRQQVAGKLAEAVGLVRRGTSPAGAKKELGAALERLNKHLADRIEDVTPTQYIESKRFLNTLRDSFAALDRPETRTELELNDQLASKGRTVPELVRFLMENKLKFAPGQPDEAPAYREVQEQMRKYAERAGR